MRLARGRRFLRRLLLSVYRAWRAIRGYRPSWFELGAIALIIVVTVWWIWSYAGWRGLIMAPVLLLFGYLAGDMLYDLWFGRKK